MKKYANSKQLWLYEKILRWPATVTAKSFCPRQSHFAHGQIILPTAKSLCPRQNHFAHDKTILLTAKLLCPRQNHFAPCKIIMPTPKSFFTRGKTFRTQVTLVRKVFWKGRVENLESGTGDGK